MICPHCKKQINQDDWLKIPELNIEVEINVHDKNISYIDGVKTLKPGERFLSLMREKDWVNEVVFLENHPEYSKILKMDGSSSNDDFYIEQPFNLNEENNYEAGFIANSGWAVLSCGRDPSSTDSSLGVRKCRNLKG